MSGTYKVGFNGLLNGVQELNDQNRAITQNVDNFDSEVQASLANWDGAAKESYRAKHQEWTAALAQMAQYIALASSCLENNHNNYHQTEGLVQGKLTDVRVARV